MLSVCMSLCLSNKVYGNTELKVYFGTKLLKSMQFFLVIRFFNELFEDPFIYMISNFFAPK